MMTTNTDQQVAQSETLRQIAEKIVNDLQSGPNGIVFHTTRAHESNGNIARSLINSIEAALGNERKRCARVAEVIPDSKFDLDHEPAQTEQQIRDGIARAIRQGR